MTCFLLFVIGAYGIFDGLSSRADIRRLKEIESAMDRAFAQKDGE